MRRARNLCSWIAFTLDLISPFILTSFNLVFLVSFSLDFACRHLNCQANIFNDYITPTFIEPRITSSHLDVNMPTTSPPVAYIHNLDCLLRDFARISPRCSTPHSHQQLADLAASQHGNEEHKGCIAAYDLWLYINHHSAGPVPSRRHSLLGKRGYLGEIAKTWYDRQPEPVPVLWIWVWELVANKDISTFFASFEHFERLERERRRQERQQQADFKDGGLWKVIMRRQIWSKRPSPPIITPIPDSYISDLLPRPTKTMKQRLCVPTPSSLRREMGTMQRNRGRPKRKGRRSRMEKLKALLKGTKDSEPEGRSNAEEVEKTTTEISNAES